MTDIQKFDSQSLMDGVRDRIKATFVSLIPDEQWDALIKKESEAFFGAKDRWGGYSNKYSDFEKLANEVMMKVATEKVEKFISEYKSTDWTDSSNSKLNEKLVALMSEKSSEILVGLLHRMFQDTVNSMVAYNRNQ